LFGIIALITLVVECSRSKIIGTVIIYFSQGNRGVIRVGELIPKNITQIFKGRAGRALADINPVALEVSFGSFADNPASQLMPAARGVIWLRVRGFDKF